MTGAIQSGEDPPWEGAMILTLLWKWLRGLWRDAHPAPALDGDAAFEGERPRPGK